MAAGRPQIPARIKRQVFVEAGHRCAIPTCRQPVGLQIHHIVPWSHVKSHEFENLILLCSNCHSRVTSKEIDTKAVRAYKTNLALTNNRYGDLERRVLEYFVQNPGERTITIDLSQELLLKYLIADGLLVKAGEARGAIYFATDGHDPNSEDADPTMFYGPWNWELSAAGQVFVESLRTATPVT
ncbi:HNH endonuclease [Isoptericola dokdonensis]|uniref:HNH endonuclease n=1 Tax=Isoptericola dokdonensis TaxID=372663 RepID=UPI0018DEBCBC|nr:HNH endonuclease signature motif containing protein [Isoptericola dokdonensis]